MSVQRKETAFANLHVEFCTLDKRGAKLNQGRVKPTTTTHRFNTGIKEVNLHLQCNPDLPFKKDVDDEGDDDEDAADGGDEDVVWCQSRE